MGWRNINEARTACDVSEPFYAYALGVHWARNEVSTGRQEYFSRSLRVWLLYDDSIARIQQHTGRKIQGLLRTVDDDNLLPRATHGSSAFEVASECLSERSGPLGGAVLEGIRR